MKFLSTRGRATPASFTEALTRGLASDGGLYVPERFPFFELSQWDGLQDLAQFGEKLLFPFLENDPLQKHLSSICKNAFSFPIPLKRVDASDNRLFVLELFHGPTAAFKDVGARFLAECLEREFLGQTKAEKTMLVATSGDTGGAVAAAFVGKPGFKVKILYPKGKVSARQEHQLTAWGDNVSAYAVRGDFDDCQRIVKEAFQADTSGNLISANSISVGRLLPQMVYYAYASVLYFRKVGKVADFVIPSGNMGNSVAALWAKKSGLPIGKVVLATNANPAVTQYLSTGQWKLFPTVATFANAMDVGNPSNMERLLHLYPSLDQLKAEVLAYSASDDEISNAIVHAYRHFKEVFCPHTAAALKAWEKLSLGPAVLVATAHPAKFESIVEPRIASQIELPESLARILKKHPLKKEIEPSLESFLENS